MSIESRSRQYGKVFDHWQIRDCIGGGSQGKTAVFRLTRVDSSRGVSALKIVNLIEERGRFDEMSDFHKKEYEAAREECSRSAEQEVWLMDELRGNTNIVDYLDHTFVDWAEEDCFGRDLLIRMELLKDLRSELREGRIFPEAEVLKIGRDICTALILCHNKNILHRDVKPENIFRNKDGAYKLGDFGVSRVLDARPGAVASTGIGTYEYWPSEQMTGSYDKRVDIYSLGLVLYELSNRNRLPFAASTYVTGKEVSLRLSGAPMKEPTEVSPALSRVILKACAFRPEDRYQSAEEFLKALDWLSGKEKPANHMVAPEPRLQASARFETVPARPDAVPKKAFETQPARGSESFETIPAQPERTTSGSYLKEPKHRKKKGKLFPILLAAVVLCSAGGIFAGSKIRISTQYSSAKALMESGKYDQAIKAFEALDGYRDSGEQLVKAHRMVEYAAAEELESSGKIAEAAIAFYALGERTRSFALWRQVSADDFISASVSSTVGLKSNGTVVAVGYNGNGKCSVDGWKDIIAISAGAGHTVGLKADGTVVAVGENSAGQCDVDGWTDVVAISSAAYHTVGLKADGTVVAVGSNAYGQCNVSSWTDIAAISAGAYQTIGLKADGTVAAVGYNGQGQCNTSSWTDIAAISAGTYHTVGLKADGTVVAVGFNEQGRCNVSSWTDIVAISAGDSHTVGLKADGTVVSVGENAAGQCNVSGWTDIAAISAGYNHTVGLKSDGSVAAVGWNSYGQCNVSSWTNLKTSALPSANDTKPAENAGLEADYLAAEKLFQAGYYDQAIAAFESLNGYGDSAGRILEIRYTKACSLLADGEYDRAIVAFDALGDYRDSRAQVQRARQAKAAAEMS